MPQSAILPDECDNLTTAMLVSIVRLLLDIWSMKLFVWLFGQNGELLDAHLFFFDRYSSLADCARRTGRIETAERLTAIAEAHFQAAPDDEPPDAAAIAMPVPQPPLKTNAVSATQMTKPNVKPPSSVVPSLA
jgi:hypothetical protein